MKRTERRLSNGLLVIIVPRGSVPIVSLKLVLAAGSSQDPPGKEGLSDFTARLIRRGTTRRSADAINEAVEFVGASLALESEEDLMTLGVEAPAEQLGPMLTILAELVERPSFPQREVEAEKRRLIAQLINDRDDPSLVADRALLRALWPGQPYGHDVMGTVSSVKRLKRADLVRFHRERMGPRIACLVLAGAVEPKEGLALAERALGRWRGGPAQIRWPPPPRIPDQPTVVIVDKPEQTQTQVRLGGPGFPRSSPDFFPATVMNGTLGSGFTSRLVNEIRVNRGLSYDVHSYFTSMKVGGNFRISTFTKSESTAEIVRVALAELDRMRRKGVTAAELEASQRMVGGLYPIRVETSGSLAEVLARYHLFGMAADSVERYVENVNAVTLGQVREIATRYLSRPPVLVAVGNAARIERQLRPWGKPVLLPLSRLE